MGDKSKIEWTDATWTPIRAHDRLARTGWHCEHVSEGCRNCYAETLNRRLGTGLDFKPGHLKDVELFLDEDMLTAPLHWKRPRMVFVCSMTDLFADFVSDDFIDRMFAVMALCPQHTFQVLTKRSVRMRAYLTAPETKRRIIKAISAMKGFPPEHGDAAILGREWPLSNIWLGVSCEDQENADARIPDLLATPAAVRFISAEPLLGPIDLRGMCNGYYFRDALVGLKYHDAPEGVHSATETGPRLDWVIAGGESGPKARPSHPDWFRSLRDQCAAADDVSFFFKQWGEWAPHQAVGGGDLGGDIRSGVVTTVHPTGESDVEVFRRTGGRNTVPGTHYVKRVGKKNAGRTLDGVTHDGFPEARS